MKLVRVFNFKITDLMCTGRFNTLERLKVTKESKYFFSQHERKDCE